MSKLCGKMGARVYQSYVYDAEATEFHGILPTKMSKKDLLALLGEMLTEAEDTKNRLYDAMEQASR